jgi:hypothetical protein
MKERISRACCSNGFRRGNVGQTFLSAGFGDFPVPGFLRKSSDFLSRSWKASQSGRQECLPRRFGQHALRISIFAGLLLGLALNPNTLLACAACYGQSDSPMAKGMNWGIFSLLAVVVFVLGAIASFFVYLAKRSETLPDNPAPGSLLESTRKPELTAAECISPAGLLISVSTQEG